jgi:hypothetical protein
MICLKCGLTMLYHGEPIDDWLCDDCDEQFLNNYLRGEYYDD